MILLHRLQKGTFPDPTGPMTAQSFPLRTRIVIFFSVISEGSLESVHDALRFDISMAYSFTDIDGLVTNSVTSIKFVFY